MNKPLLLDAFSGAGGAAMGYHRAGFEIVGVDIAPQPHFPFEFIQVDALEFIANHGWQFDVIHASPPCQRYSRTRHLHPASRHPGLINDVRVALLAAGRPYVIENVPGAPLINPLILCGTMFGLGVIRHRLFECHPVLIMSPRTCQHDGRALPIWWAERRVALTSGKAYRYVTIAGNSFPVPRARTAMGIDWMTGKELAQAIPPTYTEYIGRRLLEML